MERDYPDKVVKFAIRYWEAADRWEATGKRRDPTREELRGKFTEEPPERTFDRYRLSYPELMPWPPRLELRPSWLPRRLASLAVAATGERRPLRRGTLALVENGHIVSLPVIVDEATHALVWFDDAGGHGLAVAVAAAGLAFLLDFVSDGRLNHAVQFVRGICGLHGID